MQLLAYKKEQRLIEPVKKQISFSETQAFTQIIEPAACVTIIMPFEPKMATKSNLRENIREAIIAVEEDLLKEYAAVTAELILSKLKTITASLDYNTYTKSIALFVSSEYEKIYYLDIDVKRKTSVNRYFNIRDIVLSKQSQPEFLLLLISKKTEKLFVCKKENWQLVVKNTNTNFINKISAAAFLKDDDLETKNFIKKIDDGLSIILNAYPFPLFVASSKNLIKDFIQHSKNKKNILEYLIINDCDDIKTETSIKDKLLPYVEDWEYVREKHLMQQLKKANCITGVNNVYKAVVQKRGRLLIVEKNFLSPSFITDPLGEHPDDLMYTKNLVDNIIEKILQNGGDVEFVSDELLKDYDNIVLI